MRYEIAKRYALPFDHEAQVITGDDDIVWLRLSSSGNFHRCWASSDGRTREDALAGVKAELLPIIMRELDESRTVALVSREVPGWRSWYGVPAPLKEYLIGRFAQDLQELPVDRGGLL